jgi:hypothetical protein
MSPQTKEKGGRIIISIKEADLSFMVKVFNLASEYCEERDTKGVVENGDDGCYEIIELPKDNDGV